MSKNNGRVDTLYSGNYDIYDLYKTESRPQLNFQNEAIKGTHNENDISKVFFSKLNIDTLQDAIRYQVYKRSCKKHTIDRQSDDDLKVIMRAVYLENAQHHAHDTLAEIRRLNMMVIDFCVPRILQEINMYMRYKQDISRLPEPMARGEFASSKGTKTLIQKDF
jgi:hypothetical protein